MTDHQKLHDPRYTFSEPDAQELQPADRKWIGWVYLAFVAFWVCVAAVWWWKTNS